MSTAQSWTPKRTALLTELWAEGMPASAIAEQLGGISRNGVLGKADRLGLAGRRQASSQPRGPRKVQRRTSSPELWRDVLPAEDQAIPIEQRRSLLELTSHTCRWPVGDPQFDANFFFCGAEPVPDRPYCAAHCKRAYGGIPASRVARQPWHG